MRQRILTDREREVLEAYLKDGKPSGLTRTLKYRAKRFLPSLKEEVTLLDQLLEKSQ